MVEQKDFIRNTGGFCDGGFYAWKWETADSACQCPKDHKGAGSGSCQAQNLKVFRQRRQKKETEKYQNTNQPLKIDFPVPVFHKIHTDQKFRNPKIKSMIRTENRWNEPHEQNPDQKDNRKKNFRMFFHGGPKQRIKQIDQQQASEKPFSYFIKVGTYAVNVAVQPQNCQKDGPGWCSIEALWGQKQGAEKRAAPYQIIRRKKSEKTFFVKRNCVKRFF